MSFYAKRPSGRLSKAYYHPIEAALRWCGLIAEEKKILEGVKVSAQVGQIEDTLVFMLFPCLKKYTEIIQDAINHGEIPSGRDGRPVKSGEDVAWDELTVRHRDLRDWVVKFHPNQRPEFLFDEFERRTYWVFNADRIHALETDHEALRAEKEALQKSIAELKSENEALQTQVKSLQKRPAEGLKTTERNSLLVILAALADHYGFQYAGRGAASEIVEMAAAAGLKIDDGTVRQYLNQIHDAVEARRK